MPFLKGYNWANFNTRIKRKLDFKRENIGLYFYD